MHVSLSPGTKSEARYNSLSPIMELRGYALLFLVIGGACCLEMLSEKFVKQSGKFFATNHSLSIGIFRSPLQCAFLCQQQKCCLSVLLRREDGGFLCQFLDSHIPPDSLSDDVNGTFIFKVNPIGEIQTNFNLR